MPKSKRDSDGEGGEGGGKDDLPGGEDYEEMDGSEISDVQMDADSEVTREHFASLANLARFISTSHGQR